MITRRACRITLASVALVSLSAGLHAAELDGEKLAAEKRCDGCHAVDRTLLGPPYKAIALRHARDEDIIVDVLAQKIIEGGGGNWGLVPMVPNEHVSFEEARAIARWILSLR